MIAYLGSVMKSALPFIALAAFLAGPVAAQELIKPGYWEMTNRITSPIKQTKVEKRCITPAEVTKFMSGPSNRLYTCTYPTRTFQNGQINLKGSCISKKGRQVAIQGQGTYTATTMTMTADIATELLGIEISGKARTDARRIADACPPKPAA